MNLTDLAARARTLLGAVVTWLTLLGLVLGIVADELADYATDGTTATVVALIARALAAIGVAIAIVRRVTEVIPEDRGLLPVAYPTPAKNPDGGFASIELLAYLAIAGLVLAVSWSPLPLYLTVPIVVIVAAVGLVVLAELGHRTARRLSEV